MTCAAILLVNDSYNTGIEVEEWIQENRNYLANNRRSSIFPDSRELMAGHNNPKKQEETDQVITRRIVRS
jgi:hypothetical protein